MQVGVESRNGTAVSFGMYDTTRALPLRMISLIVLAPASATNVRVRSLCLALVTSTPNGFESGKSEGNRLLCLLVNRYICDPTSAATVAAPVRLLRWKSLPA